MLQNAKQPSPVVKVQNLRGGGGTFRCGPPIRGRVSFPSIVTIWGGGTLWPRNWRRGTAFHCVPIHFNHWPAHIAFLGL